MSGKRLFGDYQVELKGTEGAWIGVISRVDGALFTTNIPDDIRPRESLDTMTYATKEMAFEHAHLAIKGGGLRKA